MIAGYVNHFICTCTNVITRRNYVRRIRPAINAGLGNRMKLLNDVENVDIDDDDLEFDDYESDFSTVGQSYRDFKHDVHKHKVNEKHMIVKRKYFKENQYNFLIWSEKEQIKYLHQTDPVQYSIERLSELFPASVEVISKILKSAWKIKDPVRIIKHDKAVERNWKLLKSGEISLSKEYKDHLLRFSSRETVVLNEGKHVPEECLCQNTITTYSKEFSSIIQSYDDLKSKSNSKYLDSQKNAENISELNLAKRADKPLKDTYVMNSDIETSSKPMTFSKFKQNVNDKTSVSEDEDFSEVQSEINFSTKPKNKPAHNVNNNLALDHPIQIFGKEFRRENEKQTDFNGQIVNFIRIPKKLWKKGQTYKVSDCFYDDDGKFLYRVPGLQTIK